MFNAVGDKYEKLGSNRNETNDITHEISHRLVNGNRALYAVYKFIKFNLIQIQTKVTVYKTLIRLVAICGCET